VRAVRLLAAFVVLTGALGFLGWHAAESFRRTDELLRPDIVAFERGMFEQLTCIDRQVHRMIEPGATVALDPALADELWLQRLPEFVFPRGRMTPDLAAADVVLSIRPDDGPGSCYGVALVVTEAERWS
jgi:hypothetical protein